MVWVHYLVVHCGLTMRLQLDLAPQWLKEYDEHSYWLNFEHLDTCVVEGEVNDGAPLVFFSGITMGFSLVFGVWGCLWLGVLVCGVAGGVVVFWGCCGFSVVLVGCLTSAGSSSGSVASAGYGFGCLFLWVFLGWGVSGFGVWSVLAGGFGCCCFLTLLLGSSLWPSLWSFLFR
ncbi:hypothetical protein IEQ34_001755 [Dendrobium chrysotoxum]|uniref:Transmembrane protein n=1 Tax=Dendrobium chrysotoxum TaxID=161865 RepID=A0AAV7HP51_DENCH|nr:hypothetical protein IEQ34_001755 [Dendrobium chrysotoxum]